MKKVIISSSVTLKKEVLQWKLRWEDKWMEVINYPKGIQPFITASYWTIHTQFYKDIVDADIFFLMNEDNKGIEGYIWMSVFAELCFAIIQNTLYKQNKKIFLLKPPSFQVWCYEELMLWHELWRIQIGLPDL